MLTKIPRRTIPIAVAALMAIMIVAFLALSSTGGSAPVLGTAVIARDTSLRAQPGASAAAAAAVKGQAVEFLNNLPQKQPEAWVEVRLKPNGARGFVQNADLASVDTADAAFNLWHSSLLLDEVANVSTDELADRLARVRQIMDRYPQNVTNEMRTKASRAQALLNDRLRVESPAPPQTPASPQTARTPRTAGTPEPVHTDAAVNQDPQPDLYEKLYVEAQTDFDNATTEAQLRDAVKRCDPILKPGLFKQQRGLNLQAKCQQLKDRALKAIEIIQRG